MHIHYFLKMQKQDLTCDQQFQWEKSKIPGTVTSKNTKELRKTLTLLFCRRQTAIKFDSILIIRFMWAVKLQDIRPGILNKRIDLWWTVIRILYEQSSGGSDIILFPQPYKNCLASYNTTSELWRFMIKWNEDKILVCFT